MVLADTKQLKWKKPNGNILMTNDTEASIEYCTALGFEQVKPGRKKAEAEKAAEEIVEQEAAQ